MFSLTIEISRHCVTIMVLIHTFYMDKSSLGTAQKFRGSSASLMVVVGVWKDETVVVMVRSASDGN